jgi:uncharacterized protein
LNVTHHCNLACAYCIMAMPDIRASYQDETQSLTAATGRAAIDVLAKSGYSDSVHITFFGGEPLLKVDVIRSIVEHAKDKYPGRFKYALITNGCLMRPELYDFFREHDFSFLWSLDGEPQVHDRLRRFKSGGNASVFSRSFAALQALREAWPDCRVGVNITYLKQTLELPAAVRFFRRHGISSIRMDRGLLPRESPYAIGIEEVGVVNTQLTQVADEYLAMLSAGDVFVLNPFVNYMRVISKRLPRYRACNSGLDYVTVSATGDIYSCYKLLGFADCKLGDVDRGISNGSAAVLWERLNANRRPGCRGCWARLICAGGCAADNRHLNGSYLLPAEENCLIFRHAIELSVHLYFSLLDRAPAALKAILGDAHIADEDCPGRLGDVRVRAGRELTNTRIGGTYRLNAAAAWVFSQIDGSRSFAGLAQSFAERHGVPPPLARLDCRRQLFQLARNGLIDLPAEASARPVSAADQAATH